MHICWFHVISRYLQSTTHSVSLQNATKHSNVSAWQCFWCVSSRIRPSFNPCHKNQKLLGGKWSCNRDHTDPPISIQGTLPLEFCRDKAATEQSSFQLKPWHGFELSMLDGCTSELCSWKWSFDRSSCVENIGKPRSSQRSMDSDITIVGQLYPKKHVFVSKKNANPTEPRDLQGNFKVLKFLLINKPLNIQRSAAFVPGFLAVLKSSRAKRVSKLFMPILSCFPP